MTSQGRPSAQAGSARADSLALGSPAIGPKTRLLVALILASGGALLVLALLVALDARPEALPAALESATTGQLVVIALRVLVPLLILRWSIIGGVLALVVDGADVIIVEFFDYRCGFCHAALEWVNDVARTRNDVRIVFKEFPILSEESMEASRAAIAAMPQGRYWQFHQALMGFRGELTSARIDHEYKVFVGEALIAEASSTIACVDRSGTIRRMPEFLMRA